MYIEWKPLFSGHLNNVPTIPQNKSAIKNLFFKLINSYLLQVLFNVGRQNPGTKFNAFSKQSSCKCCQSCSQTMLFVLFSNILHNNIITGFESILVLYYKTFFT